MKASVSVIIPNYNYSQWIKRCVESCLAQGPMLHEVIIVDDHSTDNSIDMIRELVMQYPDKVKLFVNPLKGGNHARNFGFEQSSGAYIQWLDADDYLLPGKFEAQVKALEADPQADIAYSDWRMDHFENDKLKKSMELSYGPYDDFLLELIKDNWTVPCNYLVRRSIAAQLSNGYGWNPETKITQDREYFTKAAIAGAKFHYVPGTFAVYNRWSNHTVSGMDYPSRLEYCYQLNLKYKELIKESEWIKDKMKYISVLNAQALTSFYHNPSIRPMRLPKPWNVALKQMHWKLRLVIPWIYVKAYLSRHRNEPNQ